jgi:hypothetical protein
MQRERLDSERQRGREELERSRLAAEKAKAEALKTRLEQQAQEAERRRQALAEADRRTRDALAEAERRRREAEEEFKKPIPITVPELDQKGDRLNGRTVRFTGNAHCKVFEGGNPVLKFYHRGRLALFVPLDKPTGLQDGEVEVTIQAIISGSNGGVLYFREAQQK